jgi:Zn-dependent protease
MTVRFRIGRIPVSIAPWFFVTAVFLNYGLAPQELALWVVIVLASIVVHELGHAAAVLAFGLEPRIDVHGLGGTTTWGGGGTLSHGKRIVISLAGPVMGFAAWGVVHALQTVGVFPHTPLGAFTYGALSEVNLRWGAFNLLPMLPLDGGNVLLSALEGITKRRGERPARVVSLVGAALLAVGGILAVQASIAAPSTAWWIGFLALLFANSNWQGLKDLRRREHDAPMRASLEKAYEALDAKDSERVLALARPVALESQTVPVRAEALQLVAFGFLLEGRLADADAAIAALPPGFSPHPSLLQLRATVARQPSA